MKRHRAPEHELACMYVADKAKGLLETHVFPAMIKTQHFETWNDPDGAFTDITAKPGVCSIDRISHYDRQPGRASMDDLLVIGTLSRELRGTLVRKHLYRTSEGEILDSRNPQHHARLSSMRVNEPDKIALMTDPEHHIRAVDHEFTVRFDIRLGAKLGVNARDILRQFRQFGVDSMRSDSVPTRFGVLVVERPEVVTVSAVGLLRNHGIIVAAMGDEYKRWHKGGSKPATDEFVPSIE
jgi:hypothetical protein